MKKFEDYQDGDLVLYKGNLYKATKSTITRDAFKLKSTTDLKDELVDISEIQLYATPDTELPRGRDMSYDEFISKLDSDCDSSGIYHVED